ncbi:MAG TPA: hypothetical protein VJ063_09610 [Verrucomicrobiae bacterium]|nr:hypothetical protein [Verrucomicrobiae bacterium]
MRHLYTLIAGAVLLLAVTLSGNAANIMVVTDRADLEQGTAGLAGYLRGLGYTVEVSASPGNASEFRTLDATKISRLTAKDLVIVHRATSSGDFNTDATERSTWNNMNVPILVMSSLIPRSSRWNWMPGDSAARAGYTDHVLVNTSHPIVSGLGPNYLAVARNLDVENTTDTANGVLIANAPASGATIADWGDPGGVPAFFRGTSGETHIRRRVFCALHNYHEAGAWTDISANGKEIIARAVAYTMTGTIGSQPPYMLNLSPAGNLTFYPAANGITFQVTNTAPIETQNIKLVLNGSDVSSQLNITGDPTSRTVAFQNLQSNTVYTGSISVTNVNGEVTAALNFDTFAADVVTVVEAEDYNYDASADTCDISPPRFGSGIGGSYIDNPSPGAYSNLVGVLDVDYSLPIPLTTEVYRCSLSGTNSVAIQFSSDYQRPPQVAVGAPEFHVGQMVAGEWMNYTRTYASPSYTVFLRLSSQVAQQVRLDKVSDNDPNTPPGLVFSADQTTVPMGVFQAPATGTAFRTVPLTDSSGNLVTITLSGAQTIRLTALSANNNLQLNYLVLVPTEAAELPPYVSIVSPAPGSVNVAPETAVNISIVNRSTAVDVSSLQLYFDGADVTSASTVDSTESGASVSYDPPGLLATNSTHTVRLVFSDNAATPQTFTNDWQFRVRGLRVLFVVAATDFAGDIAIRNLLQARGFFVTTVAAPASTTADALNKDLIVASSSYTSGDVGVKFRDVAVPVVNWEQALQDEYGMTIDSANDHATMTNQMALKILQPHPLGGCLCSEGSHELVVVSSPQTFSWGVPQGAAIIVAALTNDLTHAVIYGYESGATMNAGFIAPARRVQLFLEDNTAAALTPTGQKLVHAALSWALGMAPDCPRLLVPTFAAGVAQLSFPTLAGPTYVIEYKNALNDATWTELRRVQGTGNLETINDTDVSGPTRFYRLNVQ